MSVDEREVAPRGLRRFYDRELAGVYRTTADGEFIDCNHAMARILGYESREALLAAAAPLRFADRDASLGRLRSSGAVAGQEACLHRPDGRPAHVVYSERLSRGADGRELVEGTLIDVSARQGGTPGDRLLAALAGGVTHRVTEPLSSVVANLGFAIETLSAAGPRGGLRDGATTLELDRALRDAKSGADAIRRVLRDLAVFARPHDAPAAGADLSRLLTSTLSVVAAEVHGRARIETSLEEALPVPGSESLLSRCLLEILLDALDAMGAGGPAHVLRVSARREGRWAVVEIEDTRRAVEQGDDTDGLLASHVVVAALRGTLTVSPGAEGGRRVRIELPAA
jgi:PAS domain S-box-containing protein